MNYRKGTDNLTGHGPSPILYDTVTLFVLH